MEFLNRIKAIVLFFDKLTSKEMQVLKHWIKNSVEEKLAEEAVEILSSSREEVESMVASNAFILTEMQEQAKKEGRAEGRVEGRAEGKEERSIEIAKNLLDVLDDETISLKTGIDIEEVKKLRNEI